MKYDWWEYAIVYGLVFGPVTLLFIALYFGAGWSKREKRDNLGQYIVAMLFLALIVLLGHTCSQ